ncbi:MAG: hypothetical protein QM813_16960 [Verrucomicrobiota bacterium]
MAIERKKFWQEGERYLCETSYYHPDTDNVSTAFVKECSKDEFDAATAVAEPAPIVVETPVEGSN